ncbi:MAG: UDP-N-acetylglucosamine--N-acetylmuramyl-(pentapeptide) pyrophosphoryl-undecaprenol N-acetylglucosamine transferase [Chroococcopsis gigantea SAG 12.99]|jgi:UDP-N-acetylglucosamine--N-acetylmuramyl-(pentapeptide) pyrophosphoryl-undecaprenol N-acetylglucosamine transferase|nr:undecaprenyldiphospho-muramoylpentapeptide beta-N-acetylglucosaminyltransferase [Chlorogloea purpurea SAG 13.99]MDV2998451.1 UDP-N-acetylglucosamine--N-acetylmuramyl-(pentapeptide) pyrophosphoryl-undecaprenol N-acetylglucosamine transferase [Chroococcopsis gigantea SAG 12.99]
MNQTTPRLLIAASGTGGHLFPALAVAEQLPEYAIEWLGVPDRLETGLVPDQYLLHTIAIEGFQSRPGLKTIKILTRQLGAVLTVKKLLQEKQIDVLFTTGGYIAGPSILAARWLNIPVILHESNSIPGKVTRFLSRFCDVVALGFAEAAQYLPGVNTKWVSTPVREQFRSPQELDLPVPPSAFLIVVVGGSQGAIALNDLIRTSAPRWFDTGAYIVHLTGEKDPNRGALKHPQYIELPFYENMAGLFQRADLAVSRSGSGTLTELAITGTPSILIPYPFAAEDHQFYNAQAFAKGGAAYLYRQNEITSQQLGELVKELIASPGTLQTMREKTENLAVKDSAGRLADLIRSFPSRKSQR